MSFLFINKLKITHYFKERHSNFRTSILSHCLKLTQYEEISRRLIKKALSAYTNINYIQTLANKQSFFFPALI